MDMVYENMSMHMQMKTGSSLTQQALLVTPILTLKCVLQTDQLGLPTIH